MVFVGNPFVKIGFVSLKIFLFVELELYYCLKMGFCCLGLLFFFFFDTLYEILFPLVACS